VDALGSASREQLADTAWILNVEAAAFGTGLAAGGSGSRPAQITSYAPDRVELTVPDGPAGVLVLTDAFGPGWTATVDDAAVPVAPVDLAFRGCAMPAGAHHVVFRYLPVATYLGLVLAALAAVATAGGALLVRRADRRRLGDRFGYAAGVDDRRNSMERG
jgi:hypothetical protein